MCANGYVGMRSWKHGDQRCRSLQFPGIPVPLEPSLCLKNGMLWMAATPQALRGAIDHANRAQTGLVDTERFRSSAVGSMEHLMSFSYQDTHRLVRDGYGLATLAFSALRNAVRSPHTLERDPGEVLPAYHRMVEATRPTVMFGRIEGDDIVVRGEGDRSITSHMIALMGNPMLALGVASGVLSGMLANAPGLERELENMFR